MAAEVEDVVRNAVQRIRSEGGKVVGLIGFSQGTKVVAGLLKATEIRRALSANGLDTSDLDWCDFPFGLSICGSYPPPLLPSSILSLTQDEALLNRKISIPTLHVLGLQDEFHWAGQELISKWYEVGEGKSVVREWEMGHHYPIKQEETEEIGKWMVEVLRGLEGR
jgi:hypothetical protein